MGSVCSHSVLLRDSGAHTHLSLRHSRPAPPLPLRSLFCPLLPLLGCFFPPTSSFLSFFPPFLLTHMHKTLFISHPAPSVLSASRSSLFLSYSHSNPGLEGEVSVLLLWNKPFGICNGQADPFRGISLTSLKSKKVKAIFRKPLKNWRFWCRSTDNIEISWGFSSLKKIKWIIFIFLLIARSHTDLYCWFLLLKQKKTHRNKIAKGREKRRFWSMSKPPRIIHFPFKCSISNRALNQWKV